MQIAWIGTGIMGAPMARRLLKEGHKVSVFNRSTEQAQRLAMMTSMFFVMLPMMYLSGFIVPVESMPDWVQPIAGLMPLRYFLVIVRGVMLKGATAADLMPSIVRQSGLSLAIFCVAILSFRKRSD